MGLIGDHGPRRKQETEHPVSETKLDMCPGKRVIVYLHVTYSITDLCFLSSQINTFHHYKFVIFTATLFLPPYPNHRFHKEVCLQDLIEYVLRGSWPENIAVSLQSAMLVPAQYVEAIITDDALRMEHKQRDTIKMRRLLRSLARNESTTATNRTLIRDIREQDGEEIMPQTISEYLDVFQRLFLLNDQPAYSASMRSSVRIKQQVKHHFCDPSIAAALMQCTPENLVRDLNTLGLLFEGLVERDLGIYADTFDGKLYHYQDYKGQKIDAVIEHPDGNWYGFEIKLGAEEIDAGAENLLRISREFEADPKAQKPQALWVICGISKAAYRRPNGVYVVPITSLRN